jgi:hypothetical protein
MAERRAILFAWTAWLAAGKSVGNARYALEQLAQSRHSEIQEGRIVVNTSENGGSVSFAVPQNLGPEAIVDLAHQAVHWIDDTIPEESWEDAEASESYFFPKRITRLVPRFSTQEAF